MTLVQDITTTVELPTTVEVPASADVAGGATDIECAGLVAGFNWVAQWHKLYKRSTASVRHVAIANLGANTSKRHPPSLERNVPQGVREDFQLTILMAVFIAAFRQRRAV